MTSAMHAGGSTTVIPATAAPTPVAAPKHGRRPDTMVCQAYADHYTCVTADMASRLGWNPTDHTPEELAALGEQLIVDYTLHGDEASSARLLLALARAAGALDPAMDASDRDKIADRISLFLKAEFKDELAISQALAALLGLRIPTRQELAHELLRKIGLDPERKVDIPQLVDPENPLATNEAKKAGDHYFNRDKLSAQDIRGMSDRPLSDAEVAACLAALPDSLDALFAQRFDAYTQAAADKTVKLIDSWLAWICKKHGAKPGETGIEISSARLQYYWPEVHPLHWTSQVRRNGRTRIEVPAGGYIATVHAAGGSCRYFLSTTDGSAFPLPADADIREWLSQHQGLVFGDPPAGTGQDRSPNNRMRTRVVLDTLGRSKHSDLSSLLMPVLRGRFDKARESARGQTPAEQAIDSLLDCIPFRRMIVASRDGDENTAVMAGTIDVLTFAIPMLSAKLRLAAGAARGLAPAVRTIARGGIRAGIAEWLSELSKPERKPLLESTLQMCAGATARCDDRVALTLDQLRKLRLHDDIRIGRYNKRPADALKAMRELFVLRRLGDSADRKIASLRALGEAVDEVEVRLAYTVKLRQALELSIVVPDMYFFNHSKVTQADLGAALAEVLEAVRTDFYQDLVVDDTWRALLAQERAEAYAAAQGRLQEMSDEVLNQRIRSELESRGLSPDDLDAQRNIGPVVWRDMEYEILEPLTREYLESTGVALPGQRRQRRMLKPARPMPGRRLDRSRQTPDHARADRQHPAATGEPYDRRHAAGTKPG